MNAHQQYFNYIGSIVEDCVNFTVCFHSLNFVHVKHEVNQAQGRKLVQQRGSYGYPKKIIFIELVDIFLCLATPKNIYLATPSSILGVIIFCLILVTFSGHLIKLLLASPLTKLSLFN